MSNNIRVGVLIFRDLSRSGGTSIRTCGITNHLVDSECDVTLINSHSPPSELRSGVRSVVLKRSSVPRGRLSLLYMSHPSLFFWLQHMPDVRRFQEAIEPMRLEVLHVHKHFPTYTALRTRAAVGIPVIFDVHGIVYLQREDLSLHGLPDWEVRLRIAAEENTFKYADAVSVVSNRMRDYVIDHFNLAPDKVYVIPDAVDPSFFGNEVSKGEKEELRIQNNLMGKKTILFAGHFKKLGGITDLLEAYRYLVNEMEERVALLMLGGGPLLPYARQFVEREGLKDVVLKGFVPHHELPKYQAIADVLVVPEISSEYNDMVPHIKLLECLASGRPTIATRLASISDLIDDGKNGILVAPNQPGQLAEGIARVLRDESLQKRLSYYGSSSVTYERTWANSAQRAVQAYQDILLRRRQTK